ncbi:MAG: SLOG family protein [Alistipes sp.]|jgi:uncharacterized phage-like protein YoqJ|nr:SLOG family protein [Alistipes sp.]
MNFSEQNNVVCFSGHRRYAGAADDEVRLEAAVAGAWADGYRVFISGMAPGFDLAAAEAVVRLKRIHKETRLIAAIPFAAQASGYGATDRARYGALLAAADEVKVLAEGYSHGCYYRRDEWMVERSGRLICWFDASGASEVSGRKAGGTRYTVRRALKAGLEIVNIFRTSDELF